MSDALQFTTVKDMPCLLTAKEVAQILGITSVTLRLRRIPFIRVGRLRRYRPGDVQMYIELNANRRLAS